MYNILRKDLTYGKEMIWVYNMKTGSKTLLPVFIFTKNYCTIVSI